LRWQQQVSTVFLHTIVQGLRLRSRTVPTTDRTIASCSYFHNPAPSTLSYSTLSYSTLSYGTLSYSCAAALIVLSGLAHVPLSLMCRSLARVERSCS
jgi:hypothetical protein